MSVGGRQDERRRRWLVHTATALLDELVELGNLVRDGAHLSESNQLLRAEFGGLVRELPLGQVKHHPLRVAETHDEAQIVLREPKHLVAQEQRDDAALVGTDAGALEEVAQRVPAAAVVARIRTAQRARGRLRDAALFGGGLPAREAAIERGTCQKRQAHLVERLEAAALETARRHRLGVVNVHPKPKHHPKRLIAEPFHRHVAELKAGAVLDLGRVGTVSRVEFAAARGRVDHCERACERIWMDAAPHDEQQRAIAVVVRHHHHAPRIEVVERLCQSREERALLPLPIARVRELVGELSRVLELGARGVERRTCSMRQLGSEVARLEHLVKREREHLDRDVHLRLLKGGAGDEGVGELGGECGVQPDGWRLRVQVLQAQLARTALISRTAQFRLLIS